MTRLQREINEIIRDEVSDFILTQSGRKRKVCLAYRYGRPSRKCKETFVSARNSAVHQFCSPSCYSKLHRIPGFVRRVIKEGR